MKSLYPSLPQIQYVCDSTKVTNNFNSIIDSMVSSQVPKNITLYLRKHDTQYT